MGVKKELMKRGRFADIDTEYAPLNDEQRAKLRTEIEVFYRGFVQRVADGRKRKYDDVEPLAQGRVWTGAQARKNGLIDEIGGIDRAIEVLKQKANIAATEKVTLVPYPPRRNLLHVLMDRDTDLTSIESGLVNSRIESRLREVLGELPLGVLSQGGIFHRMPYVISIR